ncbi:MAG TPA: hypothetical protein VJW93_00070, partial [Candidatus Acidoferrales bacterium]|nr:hypothetical protein [Candidatus Acidoferrales bacterium]
MATPFALRAASPADSDGRYDPVADSRAIVTVGHARFTILTPQLIRMEWAADAKFEDHASLVFLNRKLPVRKFSEISESMGGASILTIQTSALTVKYRDYGTGNKFAPENLTITFQLNGKDVVWNPGVEDTGNLLGTARTLDGVRGSNTKLEPGLVSRDGWTLVD